MEEARQLSQQTAIEYQTSNHNQLSVKHLTLTLPSREILLKDLQLNIEAGDSLLISGASGTGKSTLLRALAGIWSHGQGQIILPQNTYMMFLPQKPYLPIGTLRNALLYPDHSNHINDEEIITILNLCGLNKLTAQLNAENNWAQELSLGEQQLIAFARIFLQKPDWIFLDEATSALDENTESRMYKLLREHFPEATIISVGHRSSLNNFHIKKIHLTRADNSGDADGLLANV